jgi:hypothetical protein
MTHHRRSSFLTDTNVRDRRTRQQRHLLSKPHAGWSREDYERELRVYIAARGRAPQTATMHPHTAATLGLGQQGPGVLAPRDGPLVVTSTAYAPELITLYY